MGIINYGTAPDKYEPYFSGTITNQVFESPIGESWWQDDITWEG